MRLTEYLAAGILPLAVATPAHASAPDPVSSAYGVYAGGALAIPAQPWVTSSTGPGHKALELPANPVLNLALFDVNAKGHHSSATVVNLRMTHPELRTRLPGGLLAAKALTARCDDGVGSVRLAGLSVAGHEVPAGGPPGTGVVLPARGFGLRVTPNKQVRNPDGTLTVIALELDISLGTSLQTIDLASATCGRADGRPVPAPAAPGPDRTPSATARAATAPERAPAEEAPRPTPVPTDLPVTG
jgi:hypothetical protein